MPFKNKNERNKYLREHYKKNRKLYRKNNIKQKSKIVKLIRASKNKPCVDCNIKYPYYVMEFDHVRETKLFNIGGSYLRRGYRTSSKRN